MIPINATLKIVLIVAIAGALGALAKLGTLEPTWGWVSLAISALGTVEAYLTESPAQKAKVEAALRAAGKTITLLTLCGGLSLATTACPQAVPAVQLAACVATDALKGDTIAQIALDCGTDVPGVIAALFSGAQSAPDLQRTAAYLEALKMRALLLTDAGGGQ